MTLTGAGILWFGWFGFNAGSALGAGHLAALSFLATHLGAAGGAAGWLLAEGRHRGKPTALGAASGLVAGLVAITPAAGFVAPWAAVVIGLLSGVVCYGAVMMKERLGYDDALDAFGVHGVGGLLGALLTGVFAQKSLNEAGANGLLFGNPKQLVLQALACLAAAAYAVVLTLVILKVIDALVGLRVSRDDEREGLDINLHGEEGYVLNSYATLTGHRHDDEDEDDVPAPSTTGSPLTAENA
jgi:Amt family ammonium transporter